MKKITLCLLNNYNEIPTVKTGWISVHETTCNILVRLEPSTNEQINCNVCNYIIIIKYVIFKTTITIYKFVQDFFTTYFKIYEVFDIQESLGKVLSFDLFINGFKLFVKHPNLFY